MFDRIARCWKNLLFSAATAALFAGPTCINKLPPEVQECLWNCVP